MSKFTDQHYLKTDQYRDSTNLDARIEIHRHFSTNPYGWFKWVFDVIEKSPEGAQILELGCGPAYLWKENITRVPSRWVVILSDLSAGMVDAAWRNLVVTGRPFKYEQIDAQSIPYPDESFDVVIGNHMLYHVPDKAKALTEIKRVLKPGGRLIATTVGDHHMKEMNGWLKRVDPEKAFAPFAYSFTLENGAEQLRPFFSIIEVSRYSDNLQVTEIEPIMSYIRSTIKVTGLSEGELLTLQRDIEQELNGKGKIFIQKDSGLFEALK